jgi:exopolysaccharide biosynthesis polyprenyl glycosylphosphotransferase
MIEVQPASTNSAPEASDMNVHPVTRTDPKLEVARRERARKRPRLSAEWLLDGPGFAWLRFVVDLIMLALAVVAAIVGARAAKVALDGEVALYAFPLLVVALLYVRGMYKQRLVISILDSIAPVASSISVAAMACLAVVTFADPGARPAGLVARAWLFALVYVGAARVMLVSSQRRARARGLLGKATLIVGAGRVGAHVARRLEDHPEYGLRPIGFLDADPPPSLEVVDRRAPVLGAPADLERVVTERDVEHVILAFSRDRDQTLVPIVRRCDELGLQVSLVPRLYEGINERVALDHLGGLPLLALRAVDPKGWQFDIKHSFDRLGSALVLTVLSPLLLAVALGVKLSSPGAVLFRQRRVGRDGQVFDMLKFRSMRTRPRDAGSFSPAQGSAPGGVEGEDRRTRFGRLIRRTALDELPQLLNVVRGEMSLVGPRPERPEFVSLFDDDIDRYGDRHRVKSGITGWAQVNGFRGQTSLADRVEWDNFYIENWSLWLDVKILLLTVVAVVRKPPED